MERYRFHSDGSLFFVTFSVVEWLPIFVSESACKILTESINYCHHNKGLRTNAYVIMPTHFHAIFFHATLGAKALEQVVTDFRKFTGRRLADYCETHAPRCFAETLRQKSATDRERRLWQPSRHPVQIENEPFWQAKFDYLHANPCRKGLVWRPADWRFSSAAYWESGGVVESEVLLSWIQW